VPFEITNSGGTTASGLITTDNHSFKVTGGAIFFNLAPTESITIMVDFCPDTSGVIYGQLNIDADSPTNSIIVDLSGNGNLTTYYAIFEAEERNGMAPYQVDFEYSPMGYPDHFEWDFDYNGTIDSYNREPSWIYYIPGLYTVYFRAYNNLQSDYLKRAYYILVEELIDTVDLIAYYPFTLGRIHDFYQNIYHATNHGGIPVEDVYRNRAGAFAFDGEDTYIETPLNADLYNNLFTISCWIKGNDYSDGRQDVITNYSGSNNGWRLYITQDNGGELRFEGDDPVNDPKCSLSSFNNNEWYYVTVMSENDQHRLYIDGHLVAENTNTWQISGDTNFIIGNSRAGIGNSYSFNGIIDDIRFYNRILSEQEITGIYEKGTIYLDLDIFLEGAFADNEMRTDLEAVIPLSQPYNEAPWTYTGTEQVTQIPNSDIVDWVLIDLKESLSGASTTPEHFRIQQKAAFIRKDGKIVDTDGLNPIIIKHVPKDNLFVTIWHRNHLPAIASHQLVLEDSTYRFDFTKGPEMLLNGNTIASQISAYDWAISGSDGDASGIIDINDKSIIWEPAAGEKGYLKGDYNLDIQVNNIDKNDIWYPNLGLSSSLPDDSIFICGNYIVDPRDEQQYKTVLIGSQCWMAENLNVGEMISLTMPQNNQIIEKYCCENDPINCGLYGGLYGWDGLTGVLGG